MPEDAGDFAVRGFGESRGQRLFLVLELEEANLDELVIVERTIGGRGDCGREALLSDHDNRLEVMREGAKFLALGACDHGVNDSG